MAKEKTICEVEFEKWWKIHEGKEFVSGLKLTAALIWNTSWKKCGEMVLMEFKKHS